MNNLLNQHTNKSENYCTKVNKLTITTKEFAELLGIGMNTAYRLVNRSDFPKVTSGNKHLIIKSQIQAWLDNNIGLILKNNE